MKFFKKLTIQISLILVLNLHIGCQKNDDINPKNINLEKCNWSSQKRKTIIIINKTKGLIVNIGVKDSLFHISILPNTKYPYGFNYLAPCNLPIEFKKSGIKIIFSGDIKETFPFEDISGQPFELNKIEFLENK